MSASLGPRPRERYDFGPFRVDAEKETVMRAGEAVPLTPKTFHVLLVLVRRSEQLVTKEDLMTSVWPDAFVEEGNLSRTIFMLRKALGETAQDHRYIVTVPGLGYRLAERVQLVPEQGCAVIATSHFSTKLDVKEDKPWVWMTALAALLFAVAWGTSRFLAHRGQVLTARDTVVLAEFTNSTGDPMFNETLRQGLAIQLQQSPFLSIISDRRVHGMLRLMGHPSDVVLSSELARGVCERTGSAAVLEGSIAAVGSQYVVGLHATRCRTGEILDQEQAQAARKEDVLNALSAIAVRFRQKVGESLSTIQEHSMPLAEATTPSLEALEAYSIGWRIHTSSGAVASLPFMQRSVEIDPKFALAHSALSRVYADLDEPSLSAESAAKGWQLREHTSDREKFFIAANYQILTTGSLERARQTCEAWVRTYPRDAAPHLMLSGLPNKAAGRYERALAEARLATGLDPDFALAYYNLAVNNVYLDRLDEAESALRLAAGQGLEIDEFIMLEHDIAFLRGDHAGMATAAARARERSGGDTWISNKEAFVLAYSGQLKQARVLSQRAVNQAKEQQQFERAALWTAGEALREAFLGDTLQAGKSAAAALRISTSPEVEYGAGLAFALSGDSYHAQAIADALVKQFPENTMVQFRYLPVLRARIALNQGDTSRANESLALAVPYELGASSAPYGGLYPVYVRGEVQLAAHHGAEAAIEFQKILDHRGIVISDPIGALARLQLGRAFVLSGERTKAITAYKNFLNLWRDADQELPILREARAEYGKLTG